ncbi:cation:proton antiporter [Lentisalinibacter orientalis]|uniref:cation:proton antiporter n=1 Tax=Lentisalinibacter orientalis TaxID=2992241 RepID=UPI003865F2A3
MELFYILLVLLLVTRVFGECAKRFSQPVLVGELLAGVILGILASSFSETFPVLADVSHNEVFKAITELGIFFLMLLAGMEMRPKDLTEASGSAAAVAIGGMALPLAMGMGLGWLWLPESDWRFAQMLFIGVALSVTAVPITIATLMDLGKQNTEVGKIIVSAAVFDDVISLFLLAILTALLQSGGGLTAETLLVLGGKVLVFFVLVTLAGRYLMPLSGRLSERLRIGHIEFSVLMAWGLGFAVLAESLGMHFILGAYAAGLFFKRDTIDPEVHEVLYRRIETFSAGFLAPIFFASIGMAIKLEALTAVPGFLLALIAVAFLGKLAGSGVAARLTGLSNRDSLATGVGMNARGAVELIVAGIALEAGLFSHPEPVPEVVGSLFSAIVIMAVVTTVASPMWLRWLLGSGDKN